MGRIRTQHARLDLEDWDIRKELHLKKRLEGTYVKPHAIFSLTPIDREGFCEFLKSVKVPEWICGEHIKISEYKKW